jgi:hypothetical protein
MESTEKYFRGLGTAGIIAGVIGVVCGIVAIVWPKIPLLTLAIVAGFYLLCLGFSASPGRSDATVTPAPARSARCSGCWAC